MEELVGLEEYNLVCETVIQSIINIPGYVYLKRKLSNQEFSYLLQRRRICIANIVFGKYSIMISKFSDCFPFDEEKIREKIISHNRKVLKLIDKKLQYENINNRRGRFYRFPTN